MKQIDYNYDENRQKRHWCRWMWKRIAARLAVHPSEAVAIYLAGHQDLDRPVAVRNGFRTDNLIVAERESEVLKKLRDSGVLCVAGEFCDVVKAIASRRRVDVVFGDFTCGLELETVRKISSLMFDIPNLGGAVFAFNFLRGRDKSSNEVRRDLGSSKHRGDALMRYLFLRLWFRSKSANPDIFSKFSAAETEQAMLRSAAWADAQMLPEIESYPSRFQRFDSAVFANFGQDLWVGDKMGANLRAWESTPKKIRKSASAILAHRTMRLNGGNN